MAPFSKKNSEGHQRKLTQVFTRNLLRLPTIMQVTGNIGKFMSQFSYFIVTMMGETLGEVVLEMRQPCVCYRYILKYIQCPPRKVWLFQLMSIAHERSQLTRLYMQKNARC